MAKLTKAQGLKAFNQLMDWKKLNVPNDVSGHEAFILSGGKIGKLNCITGQWFRLVDVAVKTTKAGA